MMRTLDVRLFGAFRQFGADPILRISVADDATIAQVRAAVGTHLAGDNAHALLRASAFATDDRMLGEDDTLSTINEIAVLPPVCGG